MGRFERLCVLGWFLSGFVASGHFFAKEDLSVKGKDVVGCLVVFVSPVYWSYVAFKD